MHSLQVLNASADHLDHESDSLIVTEVCEWYCAHVYYLLKAMHITLKHRTLLALFKLLIYHIETYASDGTNNAMVTAMVRHCLCIQEEDCQRLVTGIAKGYSTLKKALTAGGQIDNRKRDTLNKYKEHIGSGGGGESESEGEVSSNTGPSKLTTPLIRQNYTQEHMISLSKCLIELSLTSIGALKSLSPANECYNTLWVVPHTSITAQIERALLEDARVFDHAPEILSFHLQGSAMHREATAQPGVHGFIIRFTSLQAACTCAFCACQRNILVGDTLRASSIYIYAPGQNRTLQTLAEYMYHVPDVTVEEVLYSQDESYDDISEPMLKVASQASFPVSTAFEKKEVRYNYREGGENSENSEYAEEYVEGEYETEAEAEFAFKDPNLVAKLSGIPAEYHGLKFKRLKMLKGKEPPISVLHGKEDSEYVIYIEFRKEQQLHKFTEVCNTRGLFTAEESVVPTDYSGLQTMDPNLIWHTKVVQANEVNAQPSQYRVVEVKNMPIQYHDLVRESGFWCGTDRPIATWQIIARVVKDKDENKSALYFYFSDGANKGETRVKWFQRRLSAELKQLCIKKVFIKVLDESPPDANLVDLQIPEEAH